MKESTPTPVAASESLQNVEEQSIVTENVAAIESTPVEEPVTEADVEEPVTEADVEEPVTEADVEEPVTEPVVEEPVAEPVAESAEEPVVEEVKSSNNDLEERVKVLEERLDKLIDVLYYSKHVWTYFKIESIHDTLPR